tara:strand:+ start:108 stop:1091 length:984 start_codon:yes stop_codon:yes gene_type:complete
MQSFNDSPPVAEDIPILDMAPSLKDRGSSGLALKVKAACEKTAFFYVKNHGVTQATINGAMDASKRFFEQSLEVKMKVEKDRFHRGYLPLGTTQYPGQGPDLKDSFDVGIDLPLNDPDVIAGLPLHGPNQWPDLENFQDPIETYFKSVHTFGLKLLEILAVSLQLESHFFVQHYEKPTILMRLMHYLPQNQAKHSGSIGATPHTDFGLVTVLHQDPLGGLELQLPSGEWVSAPFIPGTFVVNLGQLMARWTNDIYCATPHRVVNRTSQDRYSIPFFFNPTHRARVECISTCQNTARPARYPPVLAGEHISRLVQINQDFKPANAEDK